jgi:hypothetical protein
MMDLALKAVQAFAIAIIIGQSGGKIASEWPSMPSRASASFSVFSPGCYSYPLAQTIQVIPEELSLF